MSTSDIHTCHDKCPRLECVQRREIESLRMRLEVALEENKELTYKRKRATELGSQRIDELEGKVKFLRDNVVAKDEHIAELEAENAKLKADILYLIATELEEVDDE